MSDWPTEGDIWSYPYLWARQASKGETEGRKVRPSAVAIIVEVRDGKHEIVFLAVTSQAPEPARFSVEIPDTEKRRAGQDGDKELWIILDEHNLDILEQSYYLEPKRRLGAFSSKFRSQIQRAFAEALRQRKSIAVRRKDH